MSNIFPNEMIARMDVGSVSRSALMLRNVERRIAWNEMKFGRQRLLGIVSSMNADDIDNHVDNYRGLIRNREWPNSPRPTPLAQFLDEYEMAALRYIDIGFQGFSTVDDPRTPDIRQLFCMVQASESLRGQFGKRCETGLDTRLKICEDQLIEHLKGAVPEIETALVQLCTPAAPYASAEAQLLEDFALVRELFPDPPEATEAIRSAPATFERLWRFLRRHCAWSLHRAKHFYTEIPLNLLSQQLIVTRTQHRRFAIERSTLLRQLARDRSEEWMARLNELSTAAMLLNHVNLSLEPCFSFKGGVGLGHGVIFSAAFEAGLLDQPLDDLNASKWRLFDTASPVIQTGAVA